MRAAAASVSGVGWRRWGVVAVLFLLAFLTIIDRVSVSAAKTDMARELGLSDMTFGWVFGVFAIGYAILMVPSGWWADRYGPRRFLTLIVVLWSLFTALTGAVRDAAVLIGMRFLFGLAEAGAFPGAARAIYNWLPVRERGLALGLLNTGSRMGAAIGLAVVSWSVVRFGWRLTFGMLGILGGVWALGWFGWFRDHPAAEPNAERAEVKPASMNWEALLGSANTYFILFQYFAGNFTFFICFSWLLPYLRERYALGAQEAGLLASVPLYCGACATWTSGFLVDWIYKRGRWALSRRLPAVLGFALAICGLLAAAHMPTAGSFIVCFAITTFGADLTLSPSWTVSSDVGGKYTGTLSGAMNMLGSVGSFASAVTFPWLLGLTGSVKAYFWLAALLDVAAIVCWCRVDPRKRLPQQ